MALVFWSAQYVEPETRGLPENARSDMWYGALREGVQRLDDHLQPVADDREMTHEEGLRYISMRRGAMAYPDDDGERERDGLFNAAGKADLEWESRRFDACDGSIEWRAILSFEREDLARSGYFSPAALQQLLTSKMPQIGKLHGISPENLVWNAAFHPVDKHGYDHHPHVHIYFYSTDPEEGRRPKAATERAFEKARSVFTNTMFREEMQEIQMLGQSARQLLGRTMTALSEHSDWMERAGLMEELEALHTALPQKGKQQYGYVPATVKKKVDAIVGKLIAHPVMAEAYAQLVDAQRRYVEAYNDEPVKIEARMADWEKRFFHPTGKGEKAPLHNAVIRMATALDVEPVLFPDTEVSLEPVMGDESGRYMDKLIRRARAGDGAAMYDLGRLLQYDKPQEARMLFEAACQKGIVGAVLKMAAFAVEEGDPYKAVHLYEQAARGGSAEAMYRLGRLYEKGAGDLKPHTGYAQMWLEKAAAEGHLWAQIRVVRYYDISDPVQLEKWQDDVILELNRTAGEMSPGLQTYALRTLGHIHEQRQEYLDAIYEYGTARADAGCMAALIRMSGSGQIRAALEQMQETDEAEAAVAGLRLLDIANGWKQSADEACRTFREQLRREPERLAVLAALSPGRRYFDLEKKEQELVDIIAREAQPENAYMELRLRNTLVSVYGQQCLWNELRTAPGLREQVIEETASLRGMIRASVDTNDPQYQQEHIRVTQSLVNRSPVFQTAADNDYEFFMRFTESAARAYSQQQEQVDLGVRYMAVNVLQLADRLVMDAAVRQDQQYRMVERQRKQSAKTERAQKHKKQRLETPSEDPGQDEPEV